MRKLTYFYQMSFELVGLSGWEVGRLQGALSACVSEGCTRISLFAYFIFKTLVHP